MNTNIIDKPRNKHAKYKFGWVRDLPDHRDHLYSVCWMPLEQKMTLPVSTNLTSKFPPVYDQGALGSCTANAIGAVFEYDQIKQKLTPWVPSRLFIYYNEREMEGTVGYDSGAQIRDGIQSVVTLGIPPEYHWPYDISQFTVKPPATVYQEALWNKATSYTRINNNNIDELKTCLAAGFPWVFGFTVYSSFMNVDATGIVPMPSFGEDIEGGHAIVGVGYDDNTGYFKIRNSWGSAWGDHGYAYMPYEYITNPDLASDFWTIRVVSGTPAKTKLAIDI